MQKLRSQRRSERQIKQRSGLIDRRPWKNIKMFFEESAKMCELHITLLVTYEVKTPHVMLQPPTDTYFLRINYFDHINQQTFQRVLG